MTEAMVLVAVILGALLALLGAAALALAGGGAPERPRCVLPASVLCPTSGTVAHVGIGCDFERGTLAVVRCERSPLGRFDCDRDCFPILALPFLRGAPGP